MTVKHLHPDWPVLDTEKAWGCGAPTDDLVAAFESGYVTFQTAQPISQPCDRIAVTDIDRVDAYCVKYEGRNWQPGEEGRTVLEMVVLAELGDGRWASISAWNDYTGWGCQDAADVRIGATREDVIAYGLTNGDRDLLGLAVTS